MSERRGRGGGSRKPAGRRGAVRPPAGESSRLARILRHPALWAALAAIAFYLPTLRFGYLWDDHVLIERNPMIRGQTPLSRLLVSDFWGGTGWHVPLLWRPVITLSYWHDWRLFHGAAAGFHAMNVLAHAGASAVVALVLGQAGLTPLASLLGGLWFALHPAHAESVAWISGRTDVYAALFFLLAFWLDRRARQGGRTGPGWGTLAALTLALLSKEVSVAFVPLVALAEWVERGRSRARWGESLRWLLPSLAVAVAYAVLHLILVPPAGPAPSGDPESLARARWATWVQFPAYLSFLWPWTSHAPGPVIPLPAHFWSVQVVGSVLLQAAVVALLLTLIARRSRWSVPLALVWLPLVPLAFLGLTQGRLRLAERVVYLSSAGAAWLLALGVERVTRARATGRIGAAGRALAAAGVGLAAVLIVAGAWQVVRVVPAWRDDRATFAAMVAGHPQNPEGQAVWAHVLATEGRGEEAERHLQEARRLWPGLPRADLSESWLELYRSHWAAALRLVDRALAADSSLDDGFLVRGKALMELGRLDEAEAMLAPVVRRNPGVLPIEGEWGRFLLLRGRATAALPYLEHAAADASLARNPDLLYELGLAQAELGRLPEAGTNLERALALDPRFYDALLRLAQVRSALGDGAGRDAALARAAALPQSSDGRVEKLRRQLAALPAGPNREPPTR